MPFRLFLLAILLLVVPAYLCTPGPYRDDHFAGAYLRGPEGTHQRFSRCCAAIGSLSPETIKDACQYPPRKDMPLEERLEIGEAFNPWIGCYAAHKDNRACCRAKGVVGIFAVCQDICNGVDPHYEPKLDYYRCDVDHIVEAIAGCNKAAWEGEEGAQ